MSFYPLIAAIFSFVISLLISFSIWRKKFKGAKNAIFFAMSLSISLWMLFSALADFSQSYEYAYFWAQAAMVGAPLFFSFLLYFSIVFPKEDILIRPWIKFFIFVPALLMEIFVPTKLNIKSIEITDWGTKYEPGDLFIALLVLAVFYTLVSGAILFKKYKKSKGIIREQIKYFFLSIIASVFIGAITNIILPLLGMSQYGVFGPPIAILVLNTIIGYAIIRYRLMDIRIILQKSLSYSLSLVVFLLVYFFLLYILKNKFYFYSDMAVLVGSVIASLVGAFIIPLFVKHLNDQTNSIFFANHYEYAETLEKINEAINQTLNLDVMLSDSLDIVSKTMGVNDFVFFLYDKEFGFYSPRKISGFSKDADFQLRPASPLLQYLSRDKRMVVSEELELILEEGNLSKKEEFIAKSAIKKLKDWSVYLCQPVFKKDELLAVVCFGEKTNNNQYSAKDLRLISAFSNQIVVALENYMVYDKLTKQNLELEKNMKLMMGRELKMAELKVEIKNLNEKLSKKNNAD